MSLPIIEFNGIDTDGECPPDELLYHPDEGSAVELIRRTVGAGRWELRIWVGDDYDAHFHDDFEAAFLQFCAAVGQTEVVA